jgi:serine/threonine-protein kinase HipA
VRKADVLLHDRVVGTLEELEQGYRFTYHTDYLENPDPEPVSLSLPIQAEPFDDKRLFPFFDGLIPEGWLLEIAETTWKLDPRDRMGLLLACCRDCIGAAGVVPVAQEGEDE